MASLGERWNNFWFKPVPPDNLALCRIILFGTMFLFYVLTPHLFPTWGWHQEFSAWGEVSDVFWSPIWLFERLHIPRFSTEVLAVLQAIWRLALAFSCIGFFTRCSTATSFILGLYLFGLPNNFGRTHHLDTILVFAFLIMAVSRCGDSWSVDHLIRTARYGSDSSGDRPILSGEYTWPVRTIWLVMSLVLFAAGVSKIRHSGLGWITSDSMGIFLTQSNYHDTDAEPLTSWGLNLAQFPWAPHLLAAAAVMLELGFPIALFSRRARWFIVPSGALMQFGIAILMGPNFYQSMICSLLWVPWNRVACQLTARRNKRAKYALVFDGSCGLCQRTVAVVRSLDLMGRVDLLDAVKQWPEITERFPHLDQQQCLTEMHVITSRGRVSTGFEAYRALARALPLGWLVLPALYLPGVGTVGSRVYSSIASRRHRGTCPLPASSLLKTCATGKVGAVDTGENNQLPKI
jgi:predicted DCC family thiol-disulfide oxidoreductase YuxK